MRIIKDDRLSRDEECVDYNGTYTPASVGTDTDVEGRGDHGSCSCEKLS